MGHDHVAEHDEEVREDWLENCRMVLQSAPEICAAIEAFMESQLAAGENMMDVEAFENRLPLSMHDLGVEVFQALVPILERRRGKFWSELAAEHAALERD